jgi:geranylgeranyl diphosphate synthase, type II
MAQAQVNSGAGGHEIWAYLPQARTAFENLLTQTLPISTLDRNSQFNEAVNYALYPGGKRLRPALTLLGSEIVGGRYHKALPMAVVTELVHSSSLIFDDLPCMDDARLRRGRAPLHIQYGEAMAVLVGIALLNSAYQLTLAGFGDDRDLAIRAHKELVECIGANGMVGAQALDLKFAVDCDNIEDNPSQEALCYLKTSALFTLSLRLGAIVGNAAERQLETLSTFSRLLGFAFQKADDLVDRPEDARPGAETDSNDQARYVESLTSEAKQILVAEFGLSRPARILSAVADYVLEVAIAGLPEGAPSRQAAGESA